MEAIGPGTVLNQWQVIAPLAEGGMGTVFRGEHTRLKRAVCIKCIQPSLAGEDSIIRRFEREATVLASIHHPNVVSVIDLGQLPSGGLFLVLELVEGQNLRQLMRENWQVDVPRALDLVRQILTGLEEVHQHQIIHRDLKPANLLIRRLRDGTELVQLADFGIARAVSERDMTDSGLTGTGMVLGTPGYMAPEQILGEQADARADLYAVGVILYELLSARRLFDAEGGLEVLHKHLSVVPPAPLGKEHSALNAVVARALGKKPEERFQTAREFREALAQSQRAPQKLEAVTVPEHKPGVAVTALQRQAVATVPAGPVAPKAPGSDGPTRQTPFAQLVDVWSKSQTAERAQHAATIEKRIAEACGQGQAAPILEMLAVVAAKKDAELDGMIRASLLDRIGAVARMFAGRSELTQVINFIGNEGRNRLILSLRSVSTPELALSIARAVISGPSGALIEALPGFSTIGVSSIVTAAGELPFNQARPLLVLALNHADPGARLATMRALKGDHAMQLAAEVRKRLSDRDAQVRTLAATTLGHIEDRGSVQLIATFMRRGDANDAERTAGAAALGEIGGADAADALRQDFVKEKTLDVKCAIANALGAIGDSASIELLRKEGGRLLAPAQLKEVCARYTKR